MRAWLQRNGFPDVSKHAVDRLMRVAGMKGLVRGRRTTTTIRSKDKIRAKDLLNRNFSTDAPNKAWVTDFTYVPIRGGFAYVSFVIDLFSRRILSWASSTSHLPWRPRHTPSTRCDPRNQKIRLIIAKYATKTALFKLITANAISRRWTSTSEC
ncbi:DDE-type integrase/transposase/recombinase [Glutamicibacter sp. JL.03c]|uniref:DDE-type integrase/transposase/recombinase n=1 Tax=Glutamicibacter sp. JL.03c TaxID=2984842 RepID=UPI0039B01E60